MSTRWYEDKLSQNKPYKVLAVDYLLDGMIRVCIEKDGKIGEAQDYLATYRYPKNAEQALIKRALNSLEPVFPEHDEHDYTERNADIGDYLDNN